MKNYPLPWFRLYHETVDDEKLGLLAFEDRWHFIAILCCKAKGILEDGKIDMVKRKLAYKMGLAQNELDEVGRRLSEVGLIDRKNFQPLAWEIRQRQSDTSCVRTRAYRERLKRHSDVTVTVQDIDKDIDKEKDKRLCSESKTDSTSEPPVMEIPLTPKHGLYPITAAQIDSWQSDYPGISVHQELVKLKNWNQANPTRRKTKAGIQRHIVSWLSKTQDSAGRARVESVPVTPDIYVKRYGDE